VIKKILVPVDGSDSSVKALEFACDLAGRYDAELHLLHVVQPVIQAQTLALGAAAVTLEASPEELEDAGRKTIDAARRLATNRGCERVQADLADGPPARRILERAGDIGADMIVMGSRGLGDFAGLLVGSVSHKVSHLAECTCVTVR